MSEPYAIYVLLGQRQCRYEGEYAPEVLAAIDEYGHYENERYLKMEKEKYAAYGEEFDSLAIARIVVDRTAIEAVLFPDKDIPGTVQQEGAP